MLAERLGTPIDLLETPPGFWVGMGLSRGRLRGFSILRLEHALEPEWDFETPADELLLQVLAELGGRRELVNSPAPRRVRNRFYFAGALPTPAQVEARLTLATGIASSKPAYEFPMDHVLCAPMLGSEYGVVSLSVEPYGICLTTGPDGALFTEACSALESLGGRELEDALGP
ncbi:hypothetical protein [Myxococcus sp. CA039A]|uniref:hypothetical protein n=1 Tax=Myxococcus sp. CA039A TaxID=2741737 RepID=UPI00157B0ADA|nr:hypothetical protein [Myxococcus sp. CA039A]